MDSLIAASARALAAGDALGALKRVALRDDPSALALRGIAMAQLGEHPRARELLRLAARGFGSHEAVARARCVVAEAEVALAMRDLGGSPRALSAAAVVLEARGDRVNAWQARLIGARRLLLLGRLDEAAAALAGLAGQAGQVGHAGQAVDAAFTHQDLRTVPPALSALAELATAELAMRSLRTGLARAALARAQVAADMARVSALHAELSEARAALDRPAARRVLAGESMPLRLEQVEALLASGALVVDACRRGLRRGDAWLPMAGRPVLFALARQLAEAWPGDAPREALIARAFRTRHPDETHRARLRVELGRLRAIVEPIAGIVATARGFAIRPHDAGDVIVIAPPVDGDQGSLLALLDDGVAWSTSALALALGASQRTVQRALVELHAAGRVRAIGQARARRWLAPPMAGFTTILLLPAALSIA